MTLRTAALALTLAITLSGAALPPAGPVETAAAGESEASRQGDDFYCKERRLGTWFYCEKPKAVPGEAAPPADSRTAAERLRAIGAELEELKARAVLEPTPDNVTAYIRFQREQLNRASTFADIWQRAIWQNPELDYTLQRPVSAVAKRAWTDQRKGDRDRVLAAISQRYGVFYFFASNCAACTVSSPIIKGVADRFGITVMAVSMDGGPNPTFPNYLVNTGQYEQMGLSGNVTPALVLFDTVTRRPLPIGYGIMSQDEVMERIFTLTNVQPGSDF